MERIACATGTMGRTAWPWLGLLLLSGCAPTAAITPSKSGTAYAVIGGLGGSEVYNCVVKDEQPVCYLAREEP